jgi:hypothetical protein
VPTRAMHRRRPPARPRGRAVIFPNRPWHPRVTPLEHRRQVAAQAGGRHPHTRPHAPPSRQQQLVRHPIPNGNRMGRRR